MTKSYTCPRCDKVVARVYARKGLTACKGAAVTLSPREAPRVKCGCGNTIVLLKGSL